MFRSSDFLPSLNNSPTGSVYDRMITGVTRLSKDIALRRDERLGFVTMSPMNLGNTICVSARVKLEKLAAKPNKIDELADKFQLKFTKLDDDGDVYDVSSKKRLGVTEFETVKDFGDGIVALFEAEQSL